MEMEVAAMLEQEEANYKANKAREARETAQVSPAVAPHSSSSSRNNISNNSHHQRGGHRSNYHRSSGSGRGNRRYEDIDENEGGNDSPGQRSSHRGSVMDDQDGARSVRSKDGARHENNDEDSANEGRGQLSARRRSRSPNYGRLNQQQNHRERDDRRYHPRDREQENDRPRSSRHHDDDDRHYRPGAGGAGAGRRRSRSPDRDRRRRAGVGHGEQRRDGPREYGRDNDQRGPDTRNVNNRKPEPTDDERDRRTVFVQQLAGQLRSKKFKEFFEQIGPVREVQIVKDRVSGRSKGVGYVEFENEESVERALNLTGKKLLELPVIVQRTEAEKNRAARTEAHSSQSNGQPFHRLYVGNIHFSVSEADLREVFEAFGTLDFVTLQKDDTGRSKGYGFVQFSETTAAKDALESMQGFEVAGRQLRVGLGTDRYTADSAQTMQQRFGEDEQQQSSSSQQQHHQGSAFSGMGGRGHHAGGIGNFDRAGGAAREGDRAGNASALDDNDVVGVNFSNVSRDTLMRRLAREPEQAAPPTAKQVTKAAIEQVTPSRCVCLKNMWTKKDTEDANWQSVLEQDVRDECNESYGTVNHIGIDPSSSCGEIYVKFKDVAGGQNAYRGLAGRFFSGASILPSYVVEPVYNAMFPKAANV